MLSERYLELIAFKPARDYRPAKASEAASSERAFVTETLSSISAAFAGLLHAPETTTGLTGAEESYYTVLSLLSGITVLALDAKKSDPRPRTLSQLLSSLRSALQSLRTAFVSEPRSALDRVSLLYSMADQHTAATLRDAALAVKHGAAYVLAFDEREAARDRTGKGALNREVLAEMRELETLGTTILGEIKSHVKALKASLGEAGWLDRVVEWALGSEGQGADVFDMVGGRPAVEEWAGRVLESWREGIRGWDLMTVD